MQPAAIFNERDFRSLIKTVLMGSLIALLFVLVNENRSTLERLCDFLIIHQIIIELSTAFRLVVMKKLHCYGSRSFLETPYSTCTHLDDELKKIGHAE